jgi:hypothetical protein
LQGFNVVSLQVYFETLKPYHFETSVQPYHFETLILSGQPANTGRDRFWSRLFSVRTSHSESHVVLSEAAARKAGGSAVEGSL